MRARQSCVGVLVELPRELACVYAKHQLIHQSRRQSNAGVGAVLARELAARELSAVVSQEMRVYEALSY